MKRSASPKSIFDIKYRESQNTDVTEKEIQKLLLLLNNQHYDTALQNQIILKLALVLLSNNKHADMIINYNPLYETLSNYLNRGIPAQTEITLNFISTLLYIYIDEGPTRKKSLYLYAQNMIRESGCLFALRNLFLSSMMQRDKWKALCRCLTEVCRDCRLNQTFCSDLIPMCIQHCHLANVEVVIFLQSLLEKHEQNNKLFHLNNGMTIFNRKLLQSTQYLQLLNTVLENATAEFKDSILQANDLFEQLQNLSRLNVHSQITQWASVIRYTHEKGKYDFVKDKQNVTNENKTAVNNNSDIADGDDTQQLIKNVIREVTSYNFPERRNINKTKQQNLQNLIQTPRKDHSGQHFGDGRIYLKISPKRPVGEILVNSFLINSSNNSNSFGHINNTHEDDSKELFQTTIFHDTFHTNCNKVDICDLNITIEHFGCFRPIFRSTPKQKKERHTSLVRKSEKASYRNSSLCKRTNNYKRGQGNKGRNRSLGAKLLGAVNSSCATIINTLKNVFKGKSDKEEGTTDKEDCTVEDFYIRKRDEDLENKNITNNSKINIMPDVKSCITCNDTLILREKMQSDKYLHEAVKKLKFGINLFGCDFKKISKTFWPNEQYMTPTVLYHLYRKLIVK